MSSQGCVTTALAAASWPLLGGGVQELSLAPQKSTGFCGKAKTTTVVLRGRNGGKREILPRGPLPHVGQVTASASNLPPSPAPWKQRTSFARWSDVKQKALERRISVIEDSSSILVLASNPRELMVHRGPGQTAHEQPSWQVPWAQLLWFRLLWLLCHSVSHDWASSQPWGSGCPGICSSWVLSSRFTGKPSLRLVILCNKLSLCFHRPAAPWPIPPPRGWHVTSPQGL